MKETIQIGVLGCGQMGRMLAEEVAASGLGRIGAVFDVDSGKSLALARAQQAESADSEDMLLANKELEAVIIALPPFLHCESVIKAARAGKHIFLEKPMALDVAACRQMNEAVHRAGRTLMVGHVLRYYEPFRTIARLAQAGSLGKPLHGALSRFESDYLQIAPWKGQRALSGGFLYEIGAHGLDWMRCLFGEPEAVQAVVQKKWPSEHEIEDLVSVQIRFDSGAVGSYLGGTGFPFGEHSFLLHFERATIGSADAFDPNAVKIDWVDDDFRPEPESMVFRDVDPLEAEIHDWLKSLIDSTNVPITGEDASKTVALIEAAYRSAGWTSPMGADA